MTIRTPILAALHVVAGCADNLPTESLPSAQTLRLSYIYQDSEIEKARLNVL